MDPSDLLVVEVGASWARWVESQRPYTSTIALIQEQGESAEALAARVQARVERLGQEKRPIRRFAVIGCDDWDIARLQTRLAVLRRVRECGLPASVRMELHLQPAGNGSSPWSGTQSAGAQSAA